MKEIQNRLSAYASATPSISLTITTLQPSAYVTRNSSFVIKFGGASVYILNMFHKFGV